MAKPTRLLQTPTQSRGDNPYLQGNFAPLESEVETGDLWVEGVIPPDLEGYLLRTGPNPPIVKDPDTYHWFAGDGMVHGISLRDGKAVGHRSRYVRTRLLASELGTRAPAGPPEAINGPANTHIIHHAGRLLALCESGLPHRLDSNLSTVCIEDFDGSLAVPMTAHPHHDPVTGALCAFGYDPFGPPFLWTYEIDASGILSQSRAVELERAVMIHDAPVTQSRMVIFDFGIVFDLELVAKNLPIPYRWDGEHPFRLGIVSRYKPEDDVIWIPVDPCFAFHVMGAFDDGDDILVDLVVYDQSFDLGSGGRLGSGLPRLERWRIDPLARRLYREVIEDRPVEFPRIDEARETLPYRFGYAAEINPALEGGEQFSGLLKFDRQRSEVEAFSPPAHISLGEPIFVRAEDGKSDEEGWILTMGYDSTRDASDLYILDASRFTSKPEAVIHLPGRVPYGFHGSFVRTN